MQLEMKTHSGITFSAIDANYYLGDRLNPDVGAVLSFLGLIRRINQGMEVLYLEYEAYEAMAERMIQEIIYSVKSKWELLDAFCLHRIGRVEVGEAGVIVITSSVHRDEAYKANREIVDLVKHEVPIWKHEFYTDGSSTWHHNCHCLNH